MKIEFEGKEIEIADDKLIEQFKKTDAYNAEIERIAVKREGLVRDSLVSEKQKELDALKAEYEAKIKENVQKATGSKDEQYNLLLSANEEMRNSLAAFKQELQAEKEGAKKASLQAELTGALANVPDEFVRNSLVRDAMSKAIVGEDGNASFKLDGGAIADSKALAEQLSKQYPQHFKSPQPDGLGVKGGATDTSSKRAQLTELMAKAQKGELSQQETVSMQKLATEIKTEN